MADQPDPGEWEDQEPDLSLTQAVQLIGCSENVVFFTGAGMSADSGVPTFRGDGGLWQGYRPEDLATPEAFESSPEVVRSWYQWRRDLVRKAEPHAGHHALAKWCLASAASSCVITQNVDGLHQRSGCPDVIELHGSILHDRCHLCFQRSTDETLTDCHCGGRFRPGVVWFGEALPEAEVNRSQELVEACDTMVVIGTSGVVYPAAGLVNQALHRGVNLIEVNPDPVLSSPVLQIEGSAGVVIPQLLKLE